MQNLHEREDSLKSEQPSIDRRGPIGPGGLSASGDYVAVSLSGGKDSSCLLILMIEREMPIDIVLTADTGMEFPEMYEHLEKMDAYLYRERGIHITTLRSSQSFEWLMFDRPVKRSERWQHLPSCGYGWPGMRKRWCTAMLKRDLLDKEVNSLKKERNALH